MTAERVLRLQSGVSALDSGHVGPVLSVTTARLEDGRVVIAAATGDGVLQRMDAATGQEIGETDAHPTAPVWSLAAATLPNGEAVVFCGGSDGNVQRIDASTGQWVGGPIVGNVGRVEALATAMLPNDRVIVVTGGEDGAIRRFDADTGQAVGNPISAPSGHTGPVLSIATATMNDGRTVIVSGGDDGTIRVFAADDGAPVSDPIIASAGRVQAVSAVTLPDGRTVIVSGAADGSLRRFNARTGEPIGAIVAAHKGRVWSMTTMKLPDGPVIIVTGGDDGKIRRFDIMTGALIGEPISGQAGRVLSVASARLPGNRPIIVSGGRTIHRFDARTGNPLGEPVTHPTGRVWAVAVMPLENRTMVVCGGDDGTLSRFDAETGEPIGGPISAHSGKVWAVAGARLRDQRIVLVSGGDDGTLRRFDARTGEPIGDPIIAPAGHVGPVLSVAIGTLPVGTTIVSGGGDGTVRRFDAETGEPIGRPITSPEGPTGPISAVTYAPLSDGRQIMVSGGDDGTVRRYDMLTGDPIGEAITAPVGHTGPVLSIAATVFPDGRTVIISSGDDGTLRRFDAASGVPLGDPILAHSGLAWSVAATTTDDRRVILVSGGEDGTIRCFDGVTGDPIGDPVTGLVGPSWSVRIGELPSGRKIIVAGGDRGAYVIWPSDVDTGLRTEAPALVDGGPTVDELGTGVLAGHLVGLLAQLTQEQDANSAVVHVDGRWGSGKSTLVRLLLERLASEHAAARGEPLLALHDPLVVQYDAWRESTISPEWWSLATAINRTVRSSRSRYTRIYLSMWTFVMRTARSGSTVGAIVLFAAALATWRLFLKQDLSALGVVTVTLTGLAAITFSAGRVLFWYAPALHMRTDSNPLGEIATLVSWLRRWSPRDARRQHDRDQLVGIVLTVVASVAAASYAIPASALVKLGILAPAEFRLTAAGEMTAVACVIIAWHVCWCRRLGSGERRPVVVVIDDLDRCDSGRVVGLLEAVHTLLREPVRVGRTGPGWRTPARLVVLILADGRWVRRSFASEFSAFDTLSSPVHSLGADFAQKIFDHTVLVPALSNEQIQRFMGLQLQPRATTGSHGTPASGREAARALSDASALNQTIRQIEQTEPADLRSATISARIEDPGIPLGDRFVLEEVRVRREASSEAMAGRRDHLLQEFPSLMPANPRLIKRVANTFGMLLAMKGYLGHNEDSDTIARAAIMLVRFPNLFDELIDAATLPPTSPDKASEDSPWLRPDVQQVLLGTDLVRLARCYGHSFADNSSSAP